MIIVIGVMKDGSVERNELFNDGWFRIKLMEIEKRKAITHLRF